MATFTKDFPLDPDIAGQGSAVSITVDGSTSAEMLAAVAANHPFPAGTIELGRIAVDASTGKGVSLDAGGATITFKSSASVQSGIGVFDSVADAVASLGLPPAKDFDLKIPSAPDSRWAVMRWGYSVTGAVSGTHPIGVVGAGTIGVDATRDGVYATLHRFAGATGARDVLADTARNWRLPRHVNVDATGINLAPATWLVAAVDGSIALTMAARLGYDVSFMHELTALGLTRDLGAKLDANVKATFGVSASGRYVVVVGREDGDPASRTVRIRLYKQSKNGLDFALNLTVGLTAAVPLPKTFDGFVETVFGVHGPQVLRDLRVIEQWTDPTKDFGENVAGLTTRTGLDLLRHATGFDAEARFDEARGIVVGALKRWDALPAGVAATTWRFLANSTPADDVGRFETFLRALAGVDTGNQRAALAQALRTAMGDSPEAAWLQAIADRGLLALAQDLGRVSALARATLATLDGGVVKRIHDFIGSNLDLVPIRQAVQDEDFNALNDWLVRRLGGLINKQVVGLDNLRQIQQAVFAVDRNVRAVYETGLKALSKRYSGDVAATYQGTTADTALLDVSFDLSLPASLALFRGVVTGGDLSGLLVAETGGVALNEASLSHEMRGTTHIELRLPFISADVSHVTQSLAKLSVEEHAGRVLVYEFTASDRVNTANRARSELSVLGTVRAAIGSAGRVGASGTIAYEARYVKAGMRSTELEVRTRPFINAYLSALFPAGDASLAVFYRELSAAGGEAAPAHDDRMGDGAVSMQVAYPAGVLESWLIPRDEVTARADAMRLSRAVQVSLKRLLTRTYLDDLDNLQAHEAVAALLVWASLPVSTSITVNGVGARAVSGAGGSTVQFNTDRDVFWDYASVDERRAVARDPHTAAALGARLSDVEARLGAAGRHDANLFDASRSGQFVDLALNATGDLYLFSLLNAEARIVSGATGALRTIAETVGVMATAPSVAVRTLSEFAATLVDTFNGRLQFLYTPEAIRTLGPTILADASAAIHPAGNAVRPSAMLKIYVLGQGHGFGLKDFLEGALPPRNDVASAQTLVTLG